MDLARAGGKLFIGGTLALAAIDGALVPLLLAVAIGAWAAKRSHRLAQDSSDLITDTTYHGIEMWAAAKVDEKTGVPLCKEEQDERRTNAKALIAQLEKQHKLDQRGNTTLMQIMGIGAYAAPLLGLGYIVGTIRAEYLNDEARQRLHELQGNISNG